MNGITRKNDRLFIHVRFYDIMNKTAQVCWIKNLKSIKVKPWATLRFLTLTEPYPLF